MSDAWLSAAKYGVEFTSKICLDLCVSKKNYSFTAYLIRVTSIDAREQLENRLQIKAIT